MRKVIHQRPSLSRLLLTGLAFAALSGCAAVPEVNMIIEQPTSGSETPRLVNAKGPLTPAQSKAVLGRLQTEARQSDILARHLAIEEAIAETPLAVGNNTQLLRDGAQAFQAMFSAIRQAKKHVH